MPLALISALFTPTHSLAFWLPRGSEWFAIVLIAVLLFGKRLPGAARGIGEALREFKRGMKAGDQPLASDAVRARNGGDTCLPRHHLN